MKVIAFYLPQFHTFKENDEWWGEGFTEWTNMKRAKPLFEGHYQPRIPLNKNYYDLSDVEVMRWQAQIAKKYGVYGFCFYHYWFSGKLLMDLPLQNFLKDKTIDINFCFSWANETWTKAWASRADEVLIKQEYGNIDEWVEHFNYLLPFFKDDRYIKKDNKPLLVIYRPEQIEELEEMVKCWNKMAIENGFDGIELCYQQVSFFLTDDKRKELFQHNIEYEPAYVRGMCKKKTNRFIFFLKKIYHKMFKKIEKNIKRDVTHYSYDEAWDFILNRKPTPGAIPCAMVGWDNTPRREWRGSVYDGSTPEKFERFMTALIKKTKEEYNEDRLFVFAWNEWAEGGYLEPDEKYEFQYLEAIKKALQNNNEI